MGLKIGLTGSLGSGKSTALCFFKQLGCDVFDCDDYVHELLKHDEAVRAYLRDTFGDEVFDNNQVNRGVLADLLFEDYQKLDGFEALIHPKVVQGWEKQWNHERKNPYIVEIPLLFEKKFETLFDVVIFISASLQVCTKRLLDKKLSQNQISARLARQLPLDEKRKLADVVFSNDGTSEFLQLQIQYWLQQL